MSKEGHIRWLVWRSCLSKKKFATGREVRLFIRGHNANPLRAYKCLYCDGWHTSSVKPDETVEIPAIERTKPLKVRKTRYLKQLSRLEEEEAKREALEGTLDELIEDELDELEQ